MDAQTSADVLSRVPHETIEWLLAEENPAVAVLTRRALLRQPDDTATTALWARRNEYPPVAAILDAVRDDGSWDTPGRDYQKYRGSLWQIHLLGELWADGTDERVARSAEYAFGRQLEDGSWSCNGRPAASIPCLTANVGRALARLGYSADERVLAALGYCANLFGESGILDCRGGDEYQLNGYCHMLTPKLLLLLGEIPRRLWPDGSDALRDECIAKLRDKHVHHCLPEESREFQDIVWSAPSDGRHGLRETFLNERPELHYKVKPGWLRLGYPLSYNSDVLEVLASLMAMGEPVRPEYSDALDTLAAAADSQMRWTLKNTLNGKMFADVEAKGQPSRWLTLRALQVLRHFESG